MEYRDTAGNEGTSFASKRTARTIRALMVVLVAIQVLLFLRILLLLLGADQANFLVKGVLVISDPAVEIIRNVFRLPVIAGHGTVLDVAAVVAFMFWTIVEAVLLIYVAPRIDTGRIDWPKEYDLRYRTIAVDEHGEDEPDGDDREKD